MAGAPERPMWLPIEDLELAVRAYNVLKREGIETADELSLLTEFHLLTMRNLGAAAVESIKVALGRFGLRLRG